MGSSTGRPSRPASAAPTPTWTETGCSTGWRSPRERTRSTPTPTGTEFPTVRTASLSTRRAGSARHPSRGIPLPPSSPSPSPRTPRSSPWCHPCEGPGCNPSSGRERKSAEAEVDLEERHAVSAAPGSPRSATYAAPPSTTDSSMAPPAPQVTVNKTPPKVEPVPLRPVFSDPPKDEEFFRARVFGEPFVPIGGPTSVEENRAFARALLAFHAAGDNEEVTALGLFLNDHPRTAWRASLVANLGSHYSRTGYYSRALATLTEAWNLAKGAPEPLARAIADHALGELLDLHGKFGQVEKLEGLIAESKDRDLHGDAVEKASNARRAIYILREKHEEAFASGAVARSEEH